MNENAFPSIQSWDDLRRWLLTQTQSHYSVEEFAGLVGRAPFTVREWCRLGRIRAEKSMTPCGPSATWVISAAELDRFRREGLLPRCRPTAAPRMALRRRAAR